ncbi:TonB-dependent receptor domain-containing protein [Parahaliea mediterranea]|uniref:TonB-dependent receptor domain-containing protein n=1 Tax=Parahaliea mediterranea TaxID=651086 RepID=UPI000E2EDD11|nr:TonB-dependent receptor [Parahaliea mediterranea]
MQWFIRSKMVRGLCSAGLAVAPVAALAQSAVTEVGDNQELEHVLVMGEKIDTVLSTLDIERRQANDLDDLFASVPSVMVGGSVGAAQKIYVRNLGEDTLNIMIDGATQSGVTYHHTGRIAVEPELLQAVEVSVGAGEATNGPGAMGGAIRFTTKDPADLLAPGQQFGAMVKGGYFDNTEGYKTSVSGYGRLGQDWSAMASYVYSDQDEMVDGNGDAMAGTASEQTLGYGKIVGNIGDAQKISLSYEQLDEEGEKLRRPEWAPGPANPVWDLEFTRKTTTGKYLLNPAGSNWLDLDLTAYVTDFDIYRPIDNYTSAVETWGLDLRNTSRLGNHKLVYGIDYRDDEVTAGDASFSDEEKETSSVLGYYVQDHYRLTDSFLLSFGTRFDQFELTDEANDDFDESGFSPNAGFSWDIASGVTLSGGYAEALRGPETNDGFKLFGTTNDPDIEAERAKNLELGISWQLGSYILSAGAHDMTIEDAIGNALPWSRHYENIGDIDSDGYTLGLQYLGERLNVNLNFVSTDAELDGESLTRYAYGYLGTTTGDQVTLDVSYAITETLVAGWLGQFVDDVNDIYVASADASIDKDGYNVHDVYLQWQPRAFDALQLTLTVKNLFDEQYLDHGSVEDFTHIPGYEGIIGQPAQGRDVRVSARLMF